MVNAPIDGAGDGVCIICTDPVEAGASALCHGCGEPFHLVLTENGEGKDCGEVWLNENFLALEFGCTRCVAKHRGLEPPPSVRARVKHTGTSARDIVRRKQR